MRVKSQDNCKLETGRRKLEWGGGGGRGKLETRKQKVEWERAGERERGRSMLRHYKTKVLGGPHMRPKQIFTCSSILASLSAESTPMGGYLSKVFSRVVT